MQDFTKSNSSNLQSTFVVPNEYGGIYDKPKIYKKGFIEARLNKDNFWNLFFCLGMTFGLIVSALLAIISPSISIITLLATVFGISFIVKKCSKVTFTKDKTFTNKQGEDISNRVPNTLIWLIAFVIAVTAITGSILDSHKNELSPVIGSIIIFFTIFFSFSLYFILINCPLAVLFSSDIWQEKRTNFNVKNDANEIHRQHMIRTAASSRSLRDDM